MPEESSGRASHDSPSLNTSRSLQAWLLIFRAIGLGLGITALSLTAIVLFLQPVIIAEPNSLIRDGEIAVICLGIVSLICEALTVKK